jgi:hypothetical protein
MCTKEVDTLNDAVLAKGEALYAVVASWAKRPAAAIAIHDRYVLAVINTIHYFLSS